MKLTFRTITPLATLAIATGLAPSARAGDTQTWDGTLYRNGGYYGEANSDERLEIGSIPFPAPATEAAAPVRSAPASAYIGTSFEYYDGHRYRNGGHFGEVNSDDAMEKEDK